MIAEILKEMRTKSMLSQKELAEKLDISRAAVCNYEAARRLPTYEIRRKLFALAKELKLKVQEKDFYRL